MAIMFLQGIWDLTVLASCQRTKFSATLMAYYLLLIYSRYW